MADRSFAHYKNVVLHRLLCSRQALAAKASIDITPSTIAQVYNYYSPTPMQIIDSACAEVAAKGELGTE